MNDLPSLERLGQEVERLAHSADAKPARRRVSGTLAVGLAAAVVAAGAAVAATTGLLTGAPVANPKGVGFDDPKSGWGVPVAKTIRLAALSVPDPAGGPPWGIRSLSTTRGMGCVQIGRVQDGRLGVIGQDGAFNDDGKFHEMGAGVLTGAMCAPQDGAGHAFLAIVHRGFPAGGLERGCVVKPSSSVSGVTPCPAADARLAYFGLLGPAAKAITYRGADGAVATQEVAGPEGAYLVVLKPDAARAAGNGFSMSRTPGSALLSVRYRDGSVCRIVSPIRHGGARNCPAKGYVPPAGRRLTGADVASPVRATVSRTPVVPRFPGVDPRDQPKQWRVTLRFRARVASNDLTRSYAFALAPRRGGGCQIGMGGAVNHDVVAGALVRQTLWVPVECARSTLDITVWVYQQRAAPDPIPVPPVVPRGRPVVGKVSVRVPAR
jgi:hypothetical protein